jgi:hypothetical protein
MVQGERIRSRRWRFGALASVALASVLGATMLLAAPSSAGTRPLTTGLGGLRGAFGYDGAQQADAGYVRIIVSWRGIAPIKPNNPTNPADPRYLWAATDGQVSAAAKRGLGVLMTVNRAPNWAEGAGSSHATFEGTWEPDASAFGDFARALARRYSGNFKPVGALRALPRVSHFEVWNEPNLTTYLAPQWQRVNGKLQPKSPTMYRNLVNQFYAGVKSVHKSNRVIAPATSPYGDPRGGPYPFTAPRMHPVYFLREFLCLKRHHHKLRRKRHCQAAKFDIASHHPADRVTSHGPTYHAKNPDDAGPGDLGRITRTVRAAERLGTVRPRHKRRPIWATEFWWASKPPNPKGVSLAQQARRVEQSLHAFWQSGASVAIYLPLQDVLDTRLNNGLGLLFSNGNPKPSYQAFRFPFVAKHKSHRRWLVWGKAPAHGKVKIQRSKGHGRWKTVKRIKKPVHKGGIFTAHFRTRGKPQLRAAVRHQTSLPWK